MSYSGRLVSKLCPTLVTPWTVALQAPLSMGFSKQECWSGLPFPSPMHKVKSESEVTQLCQTLSDPMDCSLPGSSIHGIFQARVLEWGAIAFSVNKVSISFDHFNGIYMQHDISFVKERSPLYIFIQF